MIVTVTMISMDFAAAVSREPGAPLVIEEITVAPPMPHEVRIRIICTSLCHSDITFWKMKVSPSHPSEIPSPYERIGVKLFLETMKRHRGVRCCFFNRK